MQKPKARIILVRDYDAQDLLNQLRNRKTIGGALDTPFYRFGLQLSQRIIAVAVGAFGDSKRCVFSTPLGEMSGNRLFHPMDCVYVRRAGKVFANAFAARYPDSIFSCIDLHRDEKTLRPIEGELHKLPKQFDGERKLYLVDPMLATGGTACWSIARLKELGARHIVFICWLSAPEGLSRVQREHPDVPIVLAARDPKLNEKGYIVPGLGDAGDRLFGEKNDEFGNLLVRAGSGKSAEEEETRVYPKATTVPPYYGA